MICLTYAALIAKYTALGLFNIVAILQQQAAGFGCIF